MVYQKLERPPGTPFMRPPPAQRPLWHRAYGDRSLYLLAAGVVLYGFLYRSPASNSSQPRTPRSTIESCGAEWQGSRGGRGGK